MKFKTLCNSLPCTSARLKAALPLSAKRFHITTEHYKFFRHHSSRTIGRLLSNNIFMKVNLIAGFIILSLTQVYATTSRGQSVSIDEKDVPIEHVFRQIETQTGYVFFYDDAEVNGVKVSLDLHDAPLEEALKICFRNLPLSYQVDNKNIFVTNKVIAHTPPVSPQTLFMLLPVKIIRGRVVDSLGNPLVGANIIVQGTKVETQTNLKGEFELEGVSPGNILTISYIGYTSLQVTVPDNSRYLFITLKASQNELDKMILQAYGTTSQRFNVGSISTVDAATIEKQPVTNPLLALEGLVPGLAINATSGVPGSQVLVQVRGQNTLMDNSSGFALKPYDQPLFIIDGVPFATQNTKINQLQSLANAQSYNGGISQSGGVSPFNNINPRDIESITILKDADATSIYGSEGSNGVILITTKKGHPGKTDFNLSVNTGFNSSISQVKLLNTQQFLQYRKDAFTADSITPSSDPNDYNSYAPDLTIFDQNKYTDWQKVIFGKTSNNTDIHGSLSGGSNNNTFLISGGYTRSTYNFPGDYADQRWSLHSAFHHSSLDNRFSIDLITDYGYDQNNSPGGGGSALLPPNTPDLLDPSGNLVWSYKGVDLSSYQFYSYLKKPSDLQNYNFNNSLHLSYIILKGLSISANLGYNRNTTTEHSVNPAAAQSPLYPYPSASFANSVAQTINMEPQLNYDTYIGKGSLSILLGGTYKKNTSSSNMLQGFGYANDNLMGSIDGASTVYASDNSNIYKYNAGFARLKYIYDRKYIIDLTGRRDGSSNFGPGKQFGNFGSIGGGYIFSEEKGFKKALPFISYGKLSGSYGTAGSDGVSSYQYQAFWQPNGYLPSFQGIQPSFPQNFYNPDYSWALKKSLNMALDLGLFHNDILLNATYYRDREGNQLTGYPLPIQTGFSSVTENLIATVQNKGWEFSLSSKNIRTKNFSWTSNFNISFNRNKLLSFPNLASSSLSSSYIIGQPTSVIIGYKYKDVNPSTGLYEFYTKDGQVTYNPSYLLASNGGDYVPIGNREVNYMGGLGNNLSYKHFTLYLFFQFSSQMAPTWLYGLYGGGGSFAANVPTAVLNNYWKQPGDHSEIQKLTASYNEDVSNALNNFLGSSGVYANDTYLRLKTVSLSYSMPDAFIKKMHMKGCSIYMNAQNVLTITNYKVGDPEEFNYTSFPLQRIVAFGLNLNF